MEPELSLLREYTQDGQQAEPFRPPYLADFRRDGRRLVYVAVWHQLGVESPTFKSVAAAFDALDPACVVIEGLAASRGVSPAPFIKYAASHAEDGFAREGELVYAAHLAARRGLPFIGGEPSDEELYAAMAAKGYTTKDVMAFELLRFIPIWRQRGQLEHGDFARQADDYLSDPAWFDIPTEGRLTYAEFVPWYAAHGDLAKPFLSVEGEDFAPLRGGNYFERLSADVNSVRDGVAMTVIAEKLAAHQRVLAVFGGAHLVIGRGVLEALLGPSTDTKPF